ncbi:MAG: metallophosphatase [Collinsella sp.]
MTVYVTGDIHGGVDMQKLRDWELGDSLTERRLPDCRGRLWLSVGFLCRGVRRYRLAGVAPLYRAVRRRQPRALRPLGGASHGAVARWADAAPVGYLPIRRPDAGEVFELDGSTIFTMGGATSVDKEYRIPYSSWWPQELPDERNFEEARAKLDSVDWKVDYVITHTCSTRMLSPTLYPAPGWNYPDVDRLTTFLTSWRTAWTTSAGTTGISSDANPAERIPCSSTA